VRFRQRLAHGGGEAFGAKRMRLSERGVGVVEAKFVTKPVEDANVRFFDLSSNPGKISRDLLKKIVLSFTRTVRNWNRLHLIGFQPKSFIFPMQHSA
jgi:hypothetical protein